MLWRDELMSWSIASRSLPGLLATARHVDAAQAAYYFVLHCWMLVFGDSVIAMRLLSVLAMAGAAACVALLGRRLFGGRGGVAAGLVFAVVPSISRFAQEVRFYALGVLAATLATLLLLRALEKPGWPRWTGFALCVTAVGYLEATALSMLAGQTAVTWLTARGQHNRQLLLRFAAAAAGGGLLVLPVIIAGEQQAGSQLGWLAQPGFGFAFPFLANLFYSYPVAVAMLALAAGAWVSCRMARSRLDRHATAIATVLAVAPVLAVWIASQGSVHYLFPRYLLFTVAGWALLAGAVLSQARPRQLVAALAVLGLLSARDQYQIRLPGAHEFAAYPSVGPGSVTSGFAPDYAAAARAVAVAAAPGDGIVYEQSPYAWWAVDAGLAYYLPRFLPRGVPMPRTLFVARSAAARAGLYAAACRNPAACLGHERRVWIVGIAASPNPYRLLSRGEAAVLSAHYRITRILHPHDMLAALLARRRSGA